MVTPRRVDRTGGKTILACVLPSLELVPLVALDDTKVDGTDAFPDDLEAGIVDEVFL